MIRVIEGKEHEEFIKDMCKLMFIGDEHDINFYINSDLENSISVEDNNIIKITVKENKDTKYTIIYMLQKYRYFLIVDEENKDKRVLNIINNYLSNYYMMTLLIDAIEIGSENDSVLKEMVESLKKQICNACKVNIIKFNDESDKDDLIDEITCLNSIGATCACWNVLRKYSKDYKFEYGTNALADILEKMEWDNINEIYLEIEQVYNEYLKDGE